MKSLQNITLIGHSGVGKTSLSEILATSGWFHYSGDYRIATTYLKEAMQDWLLRLARNEPKLKQLVENDALKISGKVSINHLYALSAYVSKLGKDGLSYAEFTARQRDFAFAEKQAMYDIARFKKLALEHWGYRAFINDAGGSLGEYIDDDALMAFLSERTMIVHIRADEELLDELRRRAYTYPKPMCYDPVFLDKMIMAYCDETGISGANEMVCDDFLRFVAPHLLTHRNQRYELLAKRYGVSLDARDVWRVKSAEEFTEMLAAAWQEQQG